MKRHHAMDVEVSDGPFPEGGDVLFALFDGTTFGITPLSDTLFIWTRINLNNDGSVEVFSRDDPGDGSTFSPKDVTNFNWRDDVGLNTYFDVVVTFDESERTVLVQMNGITLDLIQQDEAMTPVAQPFVTGAEASTILDTMGYESDNGLFSTTAFIDDVLITVGGTPLINTGFEVGTDGNTKGPLDMQPAGPLDAGEPTTLWTVAGDGPVSFISGNMPHNGDQSIQLERNAGSGFSFAGVQGDVDQTLASGDTVMTTWIAIGNGSEGMTAQEIGTPAVTCRQIGTVADPDDEGETCCEFEWTYTNTSAELNIIGGFVAIEAGNGGPCTNDPDFQVTDDVDFFFGDISFCRGDVGGSGWTDVGGNNRVVLDMDNIDIDEDEAVSGRIRLKTHTGTAVSLPDGTMINDGQVLAAASLFNPDFFGGSDPDNPEGLDCQTQFGPHFGGVLDDMWFETTVWQWRPLMPVPALSSAGKWILLGGIALVGMILIARSRRTANA
jgi:hypothetical protein